MNKSEIVFTKYNPLMAVDTRLIDSLNGKHEKEWFKKTRIVVEEDGSLHLLPPSIIKRRYQSFTRLGVLTTARKQKGEPHARF